jgi:hypothetical protein
MWLFVAVCAAGELATAFAHMLGVPPVVALVPQMTAHVALAGRFLPTHASTRAGVVFAVAVWLGTLTAWGAALAVGVAAVEQGRDLFRAGYVRGRSRHAGCAGLALVWLYFLLGALGMDRDLRFVPLLFAFAPAAWLWGVWARTGVTPFKAFVLASLVAHLVEMALFLVPHPPAPALAVHLAPLLIALSPLLYLALRVALTLPRDD